MSDALRLSYTLEERQVEFVLSEEVYPRDAIYGASYLFVDRCYVFLSRPGDKQVGVRLRAKPGAASDEPALEALAGEFANELLNQILRARIGESTQRIREYTMARAFFSQPAQSSIDALLAELDAEELEEDSLEISVPWETSPESAGQAGG